MSNDLQKTNLNVAPYYDDYDADKNFHRIAFKAGSVVQARELNQLQSIMQDQINRFGKHIFQEGSIVIPGGVTVKTDQHGIQLFFSSGYTFDDVKNRTDETLYLKGNTSGLVAQIVKMIPQESSDPITFYVDYLSSGTTGEVPLFIADEQCYIYTLNEAGEEVRYSEITVMEAIKGVWAKSIPGVYFVRGHFVSTVADEAIVSKYSEVTTAKIGFLIKEEMITEVEDRSLFSNALGEPNFKAPGAARLKISLKLASQSKTTENKDFIEFVRLEENEVQSSVDTATYSLIQKSIAQRTYETHGNYTVEPFGIQLKEHLKKDANDNSGVYLAADGGDTNKFVVEMKPGIGYVEGYRVRTIGLERITADKARDTKSVINSVTAADYGPFILITNVKSLPEIDPRKPIRLFNGATVIGRASVRGIRKENATQYRLYIYGAVFTSGNFSTVTKIDYQDSTNLFTADYVTGGTIYDGSKDTAVFKLPYPSVQTLKVGGVNRVSYTVFRTLTATTNGSGLASLSLGGDEIFAPINNFEYFIGYAGAGNTGVIIDPAAAGLTLSGTPAGRVLNMNLGATHANKQIKVIVPVVKTAPVERKKILTRVTDSKTASNASRVTLNNTDSIFLVSVMDYTNASSPIDLTSLFRIDDGQKPSWYDKGSIYTYDARTITSTDLRITYDYYQHTAGDYFSVDSYPDRLNIPSLSLSGGVVYLGDVIDFRQDRDATQAFASDVTGEMVKPGDSIRTDLSFFMPRVDSVYLAADGSFNVLKGVPSSEPVAPTVPGNSMKLYELVIPAYTPDLTAISQKYVENRRYTMRDIGSLEKRIENVEYYTSLSLLESKANNTSIIDPVTGNDRFKNGFATDGFMDFRLADTTNPAFAAALDLNEGMLKPTFMVNGTDLVSFNGSDYAATATTLQLPYTQVKIVEQPYATRTINVNPYAVFTWTGSVVLTPNTDFWKDVVYLPPVFNAVEVNNRGNAREGSVTNLIASDGLYEKKLSKNTITLYSLDTTETVTTNFTSQSSSTSADNMVGVSPIYFMRSIDITFEGSKFKPYTRLYPFFDGVNITSQVYPIGGAYGQALMTDINGYVKGVFTVPNREGFAFQTGSSVFRLTSDPSDARGGDLSDAETVFVSGGTLESRQETFVTTTVLGANTQTSTQTGVVAKTRLHDPIAQSFTVPGSGGNMITTVGVKFSTKSQTVPITLQIRTVENGLPTLNVMVDGEVTLNPGQVNVSSNASVFTYFTFRNPVYLEEGKEYAIVLLAETQDYNAYIAQMGEGVIGQQIALSKQPHLGVFFQSSNGSTWTPSQMQDLTFEIYGAQYDTTKTAIIDLGNVAIPQLPTRFNPFTTTNASPVVTAYMRSHGKKAGDTITISGAVGGNNFSTAQINATHLITSATLDTVTFNISGTNANTNGTFGGNAVKMSSNYTFTDFYTNIPEFTLPGTKIAYEFSVIDQATRTRSPFIPFDKAQTVFMSALAVVDGVSGLVIRAKLTSTKPNLTPLLERGGMTAVLVGDRIDMNDANPAFAYVTKDIKFDNPSTSSRFFLGAYLPGSSTMKVYYKLFRDSSDDVSGVAWTQLNPTKPLVNSDSNFAEYEYQLSGVGTFVGYKIYVKFLGNDPVRTPLLKDFRSIALA